jgi:transcriptional regulator with XRE-family HTH domain
MANASPVARLRELLAESGLSQVQLAKVLGYDPRSMRRWLAGGETPNTLTVQLARIIRIEATRTRIRVVWSR